MTCASCVGRVERAIRQVPGVVDVSVNLATERAEVVFKDGNADTGAVADAVFKAGYMPGSKTTELSVTGMTCASCVGSVDKALRAVPEIGRASVRERVCQLVEISVGAVSLKKKTKQSTIYMLAKAHYNIQHI